MRTAILAVAALVVAQGCTVAVGRGERAVAKPPALLAVPPPGARDAGDVVVIRGAMTGDSECLAALAEEAGARGATHADAWTFAEGGATGCAARIYEAAASP